jgi:hypothetical protein
MFHIPLNFRRVDPAVGLYTSLFCAQQYLVTFTQWMHVSFEVQKRIGTCESSVVLVRKKTIPTERPQPVGEVSANFYLIEGVAWSAQRIPTAVISDF